MLLSTLVIKLAQKWKILVASAALGLALGLIINNLDSSNQEKILYAKSQTLILVPIEEIQKLEILIANSELYSSNFKILFPNSNITTVNAALFIINNDLIKNFSDDVVSSQLLPDDISARIIDNSQIIELNIFYKNKNDLISQSNIIVQSILNSLSDLLKLEAQPIILDFNINDPASNSNITSEIENLKAQLSSSNKESIQIEVSEILQLDEINRVDSERIFPFQFIKTENVSASQVKITVTYDDPALVENTSEFIQNSLMQIYPYQGLQTSSISSRIIERDMSEVNTISIGPSVNRTLVNISLGILLGLGLPTLFILILIYRDKSIFHPEQLNLLFGKNADLVLPDFNTDNLTYPITNILKSETLPYISEIDHFLKIKSPNYKSINIQATTDSLSSYVIALLIAEINLKEGKSVLLIDATFSNKFNQLNIATLRVNWLKADKISLSKLDSEDLYILNTNTTDTTLHLDINRIKELSAKVDVLIYISSSFSDSHNFIPNPLNLDLNLISIELNKTDRYTLSQLVKKYDFSTSYILLLGVKKNEINSWALYENKI